MTGSYYNEIDPYAAQWLRNLIGAGLIAAGEVDERSIALVRADDLRGFTQCHFFAGIGVWSHALRLAGWPDDRPVWTGSCPCQPFSAAGKGEGTADARHLWPEWFRLIREHRPVAVFGEQVAAAIRHDWLDLVSADLEGLDYAVGAAVLGAHSVGAPHIRQRLYFVAYNWSDGRQRHKATEGLARHASSERREGLPDAEPRRLPCELADSERWAAERHGLPMDGEAGGVQGEAHERQRLRDDVGDGGEHGELAHAEHAGSPRAGGHAQREGAEQQPRHEDREEGAPAGGLEHAPSDGREQRRSEPSRGPAAGGCGSGVAQGDTDDAGPQGRRVSGTDRKRDGAGELAARQAGSSNIVGDTEIDGWQGRDLRETAGRSASGTAAPGFWAACDWLPCIDGKARPVEPGTFPLAHGIAGRVGRLRAYGNAINAEAAAAFVRAYL